MSGGVSVQQPEPGATPPPAARFPVWPGGSRALRPGERIYLEGDRAACLFKVVSGAVRAWKATGEGRRQILDFYVSGDFFGFDEADGEHHINTEAVDDPHTVIMP